VGKREESRDRRSRTAAGKIRSGENNSRSGENNSKSGKVVEVVKCGGGVGEWCCRSETWCSRGLRKT